MIVPLGGPPAAYRKFQVLERPAVGVAAVGTVRDGVFDGAPVVVVGAVDERPIRVPTDDLDGLAVSDALDALAAAAAEAVEPVRRPVRQRGVQAAPDRRAGQARRLALGDQA